MKNPGPILAGFGLVIVGVIGIATCVPCTKPPAIAPVLDAALERAPPPPPAPDAEPAKPLACVEDAGVDARADAPPKPAPGPPACRCPAPCAPAPTIVIVNCGPDD